MRCLLSIPPKRAGRTVRHYAGLLVILLSTCCGSLLAQQTQDEALYWRISQGDREAGFLLGTIHSEDPRVLDFSESFAQQLASCQVFAMEMVPDLPTLARLADYMHYATAGELEDILGPERYRRVMEALSAYQVPTEWKEKMKVWALMMTLSVPPPQTGFFMDLSLSLRAAGAGLHVSGLETLDQQLSFLENMPLDYQVSLLDQALADYRRVGDVHQQMIGAYLSGKLSAIAQLSAEQFDGLDPAIRDYFVGLGINRRNQRMLETLLPLLQESRVFVAIGALHLPGEEGLLALLRSRGFSLAPLPLPISPVAEAKSPGDTDR